MNHTPAPSNYNQHAPSSPVAILHGVENLGGHSFVYGSPTPRFPHSQVETGISSGGLSKYVAHLHLSPTNTAQSRTLHTPEDHICINLNPSPFSRNETPTSGPLRLKKRRCKGGKQSQDTNTKST
ncbi:hypothetical protein O181_036659 [Austropuccinia psidii MF-1]|uniref:Uncharacterized protein n=1 Tax=Austropuccinia psidii MF-1 TaxID=1389203 RepID=A0A9Q3HBS0_9BASI|nr:hypothetical protein [Austropuccinia psidii MF-1]